MPQRIQRRRTAGWRKPTGAVAVSRPSRWGNPFRIGDDAADAAHAVALFEEWLAYNTPTVLDPYGSSEYRAQMSERREWMLAHLPDLAGRDLMCWCAPGTPCHADILLDAANQAATDRGALEQRRSR